MIECLKKRKVMSSEENKSNVDLSPSENMTDEELSKFIFDNHIKEMRERLLRYRELQKENINSRFVYDNFKGFIGEIGYLLSNSRQKHKDHLLDVFIKEIGHEIGFTLKIKDNLKLDYLMNKFVRIVEFLLEEAEWDKEYHDDDRKVASFTIVVEPKAPKFICFTCEDNEKLMEKAKEEFGREGC